MLCRHVDVRARAGIEMGAVIGDESVVGHGRARRHRRPASSRTSGSSPPQRSTRQLIWESTGSRSLFGDAGVQGLVGVDITPELALKVAEAYGTLLPKGGHVVISRDTTRAARMLKRAMIAGLNAAGIDVRDLRVASPAVTRFTTQKTRCVGGVHLSGSMRDPQSLEIRFLDKNGLDIAPWEQKKIERLYFREEFRRAFFDELGDIMYPPRPLEYYGSALKEAMDEADLGDDWRRVVADMSGGPATFMLPQVAHGWHLNLIALNGVVDSEATSAPSEEPTVEDVGDVGRAIELFGADLGVIFDWGAERIRLVTEKGDLLDGDTALHAMVDLWCRTRTIDGTIAVPLAASQAVDQIAAALRQEGHPSRAISPRVGRGGPGRTSEVRGLYERRIHLRRLLPSLRRRAQHGHGRTHAGQERHDPCTGGCRAAGVPQGRDQCAVSRAAQGCGHAFGHRDGRPSSIRSSPRACVCATPTDGRWCSRTRANRPSRSGRKRVAMPRPSRGPSSGSGSWSTASCEE